MNLIYAKNPLEMVICQVRFPAILKISSEPPADFQEALRREYPLFREVPPLDVGTGLPQELSAVMSKLLPLPSSKAYELTLSFITTFVYITTTLLDLRSKARQQLLVSTFKGTVRTLTVVRAGAF